jgi:signal transduction histidine kinase
VAFTCEIPSDLAAACEQQDLDEMLGNVLENAFRWCQSQIAVRSAIESRSLILTIEDDGPGLSAEQAAKAVQAGQRLDESSSGFGFGLSIVHELASSMLDRSSLGGLRVAVSLPVAAAADRSAGGL